VFLEDFDLEELPDDELLPCLVGAGGVATGTGGNSVLPRP